MRRRYITKPEFQISFGLSFVRGILIALILPASAAFMLLYLLGHDASLSIAQQSILISGLNHLGVLFLRYAIAATLFFAGLGAYLSHKYAGPMTRLETWSKQYLSELDPGPLRLRAGDELTSVAQVLDRVINRN